MSMTAAPSGWYENPYNGAEEMYWDGSAWSGASRRRSGAAHADVSMVDDVTLVMPAGAAPSEQWIVEAAADASVGPVDPWLTERWFSDLGVPEVATAERGTPELGVPELTAPEFRRPELGAVPGALDVGVDVGVTERWASPAVTKATPTGNGFALAALFVGLCGAVLAWVPFIAAILAGGLADVVAISLGTVGVIIGRRRGGRGVGLALLGATLGALSVITFFL